jgi:hypothetical protein
VLLRVARDGFAHTEEVGTEGQELLHQDLHVAGFLQAGGREGGREGRGKESWNFLGGKRDTQEGTGLWREGGKEGRREGGRKRQQEGRDKARPEPHKRVNSTCPYPTFPPSLPPSLLPFPLSPQLTWFLPWQPSLPPDCQLPSVLPLPPPF